MSLTPSFPRTDIIGALFLASQVFASENYSMKSLIIFSDMRQHTDDFDVESGNTFSGESLHPHQQMSFVDLHGVDLYVLGVDGADKPLCYWRALRGFWTTYLFNSGATLKMYSPLREF